MVNYNELRIGNILFLPKKNQFVEIKRLKQDGCEITPYEGGEEFTVSLEELEGIELLGDILTLSGFQERGEPEEGIHDYKLDKLIVRIPEQTFFIMDYSGAALSTRLHFVHHLQNVYAALNLKELAITLPTYYND